MPENKASTQDPTAPSQIKPLESQAVQAALAANWEKAITLNKQILKLDETNIESHNRLGRAYSESGEIEKARSSYRAVLRLDPYNSIALKNLERLKIVNGTNTKLAGSATLSPDLFMEEPGKTKVLEATDLATPEKLAYLHTGDQVKLEAGDIGVVFKDAAGHKLGVYQEELATKLANLLKSGNIYEAYVKSVKPSELKIFVREIKRAAKFAEVPSFPAADTGFKPYVHESTLDNTKTHVELENSDTLATEAAVAKKIASVESLAEQESDLDQSSPDDEE